MLLMRPPPEGNDPHVNTGYEREAPPPDDGITIEPRDIAREHILVILLSHDKKLAHPDGAVRVRADHDAELDHGIFRHSVGRSDYAARRAVPCGRCELRAWHDDHTQQIRGIRALRGAHLRAEPVHAGRQLQLRVDVCVTVGDVVGHVQTVIGEHLHANILVRVVAPFRRGHGFRIEQQIACIRVTHGARPRLWRAVPAGRCSQP